MQGTSYRTHASIDRYIKLQDHCYHKGIDTLLTKPHIKYVQMGGSTSFTQNTLLLLCTLDTTGCIWEPIDSLDDYSADPTLLLLLFQCVLYISHADCSTVWQRGKERKEHKRRQ